jgi:hypothetical protein
LNDLYVIIFIYLYIYQNEIMKGIFSFFELRINNTFIVRVSNQSWIDSYEGENDLRIDMSNIILSTDVNFANRLRLVIIFCRAIRKKSLIILIT